MQDAAKDARKNCETDAISADDIEARWRVDGLKHRHHVNYRADEVANVAEGDVHIQQVAEGLFISRSKITVTDDVILETMREPCMMVGVVLEGVAHTQIGERHFEARPGQLSVINIKGRQRTSSRMKRGSRLNFSGIIALPHWLEQTGFAELEKNGILIETRITNETYAAQVEAPPALQETALKICNLEADTGAVAQLRWQGLALQFFTDAMTALQAQHRTAVNGSLTPRDYARIQAVRARLERLGPEEKLTLEEIAAQAGMSPSTLSRHFKTAFDTTVFAFVADQRMDAARNGMRDQGLSIAQAAHLAGFSNSTNFSTAFKRRYGITPKSFLTS